ncbi:Probable dipeptide and tripeptide permease YjdL [Raoultella planticola]|uniref:Probable dipeptide and tripeptide permease YjdL n=1 Tax=Raoultella planticola TaxID=575 RepID=A0A485DCN3_RAOPL|nr:Probable dipeptide and tripeptide permease YjdL [Raoultella planticola]
MVWLAYRFCAGGDRHVYRLLIFLSGHRHFSHTRGVDKQALCAVKFVLPTWGWLVVMLCVAPVFFTLLLENNWSGYLLAIGLRLRRPNGGAHYGELPRSTVARCGKSYC